MKLEVVLSVINLKKSNLDKMNITSKCTVINQCNKNKYEKYKNFDIYSYNEIGVSNSRNRGLDNITGDIILFCDDDVVYVDDYEKIVLNEFNKNPKADVIIFNFNNINRRKRINKRNKRIHFYNSLNYATYNIACRSSSINNIRFNSSFGPGTKYNNGSDSLFIKDLFKNKLKVYSSNKFLGTVYNIKSTWFKGYNKQYFFNKGALYTAISERYRKILFLQHLLRHRYELKNIKFSDAYKLMKAGSIDYLNCIYSGDLITIIINVYNGEKYIDKCLNCVLNQTYKNLEILIINDGSNDNTLKICKRYKDKRVKIITTKNLGLSLSRNIGLDNARGKYIYFIDVDDLMELDTIEYLYNLIKKYNKRIAISKSMDIYNYDYKVINKKEKISIINSKNILRDIVLEKNNMVTSWNKLVDRDLYNDLRFEDRIINDMNFTHKLVMKVNDVVHSNKIKYFYLKNSNGITGKISSLDRIIDRYEVSLDRFYCIKKIYPNMIDNNAGMLKIIIKSYLDDRFIDYFEKENIRDVYNNIFTIKILFSKVGFREKIKMILFRINPKLNKKIINIYLKLLGKK